VLIGAVAGIAFTQTSVMLSHTLQFAILLATFTNLTQYMTYFCWRNRVANFKRTHFQQFGPAYLVGAATSLVIVQPGYLVLKIANRVQPMNTPLWYSLRVCTIFGYSFLIIGVLWAIDAKSKLASLFNSQD